MVPFSLYDDGDGDNMYLFLGAVLYVWEKSGKELGWWCFQLCQKLLQILITDDDGHNGDGQDDDGDAWQWMVVDSKDVSWWCLKLFPTSKYFDFDDI